MGAKQPKLSNSTCVYLNRDCPRRCPYCGIRKPGYPHMSGEQWVRAFDILVDYFKANFILILGTEPLAMPYKDLSIIVRHLNELGVEYGFYTTAPGDAIHKLEKLIDEDGLRNVSAGVDYVDEVYQKVKHKLPKDIVQLHEASRPHLIRKSEETLRLLEFAMKKGVEEVYAIITISRLNYLYLPELLDYLIDRYGVRLHLGVNYVEYGHGEDFDFAPPGITPWHFTEKDIPSLEKVIDRLEEMLKNDPKFLMQQVPIDYLRMTQYLPKLNWKCGVIIPTIDADGRLRKCGYRLGRKVRQYTIWDVPERFDEVIKAYAEDVMSCDGCLWAYPYVVGKDERLLDFRTDLWKEREKLVMESLQKKTQG